MRFGKRYPAYRAKGILRNKERRLLEKALLRDDLEAKSIDKRGQDMVPLIPTVGRQKEEHGN